MTDDPIRVADNHWRAHGWDTGEHFVAALSIYRTDELIRASTTSPCTPTS